MGQLVVAAKLFGVNDLHYENIMAAGRGPTIIDGETSFLLNVMTARDFKSNELQLGVFKHVSEIDNKLSNNAFFTAAEKLEWDNRHIDDWDEFIGARRDADVKKGGPYEADLSQGITQLLQILRTNRDKIGTLATKQIDQLEEVRVVPVETKIFKSNMSSYRAHLRNGDQVRMDRSLTGCANEVFQELRTAGYRLHSKKAIRARIAEDFEQGDIPVLHYNGRTKKLMWNGRVVGSFSDKRATKKPVADNIKWLVRQTAQDVLNSLQTDQ
jgi:lantibiotic modifying enzyme